MRRIIQNSFHFRPACAHKNDKPARGGLVEPVSIKHRPCCYSDINYDSYCYINCYINCTIYFYNHSNYTCHFYNNINYSENSVLLIRRRCVPGDAHCRR